MPTPCSTSKALRDQPRVLERNLLLETGESTPCIHRVPLPPLSLGRGLGGTVNPLQLSPEPRV